METPPIIFQLPMTDRAMALQLRPRTHSAGADTVRAPEIRVDIHIRQRAEGETSREASTTQEKEE